MNDMNESMIRQYRATDRFARCYTLLCSDGILRIALEPGMLERMQQGYVHPLAEGPGMINAFGGKPADFSFTHDTFGYEHAGHIDGDTLVFDYARAKQHAAFSGTMYFTFLYLERWMKKAAEGEQAQLLHVIPTTFPTQVHCILFDEGYQFLSDAYLQNAVSSYVLGLTDRKSLLRQHFHSFEEQYQCLCQLAAVHTEIMQHALLVQSPQ